MHVVRTAVSGSRRLARRARLTPIVEPSSAARTSGPTRAPHRRSRSTAIRSCASRTLLVGRSYRASTASDQSRRRGSRTAGRADAERHWSRPLHVTTWRSRIVSSTGPEARCCSPEHDHDRRVSRPRRLAADAASGERCRRCMPRAVTDRGQPSLRRASAEDRQPYVAARGSPQLRRAPPHWADRARAPVGIDRSLADRRPDVTRVRRSAIAHRRRCARATVGRDRRRRRHRRRHARPDSRSTSSDVPWPPRLLHREVARRAAGRMATGCAVVRWVRSTRCLRARRSVTRSRRLRTVAVVSLRP